MKIVTLAFAVALALSGSYASAHGAKRHHHHGWFNSMIMMHGPGAVAARTDPNGDCCRPNHTQRHRLLETRRTGPGSARAPRQ